MLTDLKKTLFLSLLFYMEIRICNSTFGAGLLKGPNTVNINLSFMDSNTDIG